MSEIKRPIQGRIKSGFRPNSSDKAPTNSENIKDGAPR
jgi:hypothetical protein